VILVDLMVFKERAAAGRHPQCTYRSDTLSFKFHPEVSLDVENLLALVAEGRHGLRLSPSMVLSMPVMHEEVHGPRVLTQHLLPSAGGFAAGG